MFSLTTTSKAHEGTCDRVAGIAVPDLRLTGRSGYDDDLTAMFVLLTAFPANRIQDKLVTVAGFVRLSGACLPGRYKTGLLFLEAGKRHSK